MQKQIGLLSRTLIIGIILLLIGAGVFPSISSYDKKSSINAFREVPSGFPLNDDFINAFWKFDECSGDIVGDSSGHNYDGARYGATWTTEGYVGCALDFDGIDDYVNLTAHAKKIAVNKTDDYIISFYFKSTSSNHGIILSYTGYKNVPEFRIELQPNGSILFKIWTGLCGLVLYSKEGYNNGSWHNVEIRVNGITTDPTVEIYIDGDLDATITDWLCDIENSDFKAAAIGKRASDDSGFFDGIIDEFKFIKYDGGNKQVPPEISGPTHVKPGVSYEYTFTTYDPEDDDIWIQIDWGNGHITDWLGPYESGETVTVSYQWDEEGLYCLRAQSMDFWDDSRWSECFWVRVGNSPPDPPIITGPLYGDPGQELTYDFISYDYDGHDIYYIVDWDDGTTTETDYVPSNTSIQLSHIWGSKNDYNITAIAIDSEGKPSETSIPLWIRIGDEPPRRPDIDGPIKGPVGEDIDFYFTADDPENDRVSFNIKWGDGEEILETKWYDSGQRAKIAHNWTEKKTYKIEARAKDIFGHWSDWESYEIEIPRIKAFNYDLFELLLERFLILKRMLYLLR